jgi:4-hydroxy-tetrahydrodipicolinate synthase
MKIKGLGVAMITPFKNDLSIDFDSLGNLTESLVLGGVDFLVVMGTTGEAATLTVEEKQKVLSHVIKTNADRVPVVYGIGGNNTAAVCEELRNFKTQGAIKEASGDLNQIEEIIRNAPEGFDVFSGDDGLTIPVMKAGGIGVISVIGNACPDLFSNLVRFCESKEYESAAGIFNVMEEIIPMLFEQGNPAGIKALMELHDMCTDKVRLPLVSANQLLKSRFKASLDALSSVV